MTDRILFWPGRGKDLHVMEEFQTMLAVIASGFESFPLPYDDGDPIFSNRESWKDFLETSSASWWIGISLGASLAYVMASVLPAEARPLRLTIINPFSSRHVLSEERKFSLDGQWDFSPKEYVCNVHQLDVVLSLHDEKIPLHHGLDLISSSMAQRKNLIVVDSDHCLSNRQAQVELVYVLFADKDKVDVSDYG